MSEFKFSCPSCQQNIQATSEYSGMLINCPKCGGKLIVPSAPDAPAAQSGSKLSMAASTPHAPESAAAAATFYAAPVRKKKPKTGLIVGLSLGAIAAAGAVYFWPQITKLVASHGTSLTAAADDQAPTNAPPPPPPPLTTEEILQKVGETYRGMADYTAKGKTDCSIDMSGIAPGKGTINMSSTSTLELGRTDNFRLEWEERTGGKTIDGAAWSAGKGTFIGYSVYPPTKVKSRQDAMETVGANFFLLSSGIAELFFAETNSLAAQSKDFTKTNGPSSPDGQPSYVLTGEANHQSVLLWVNKDSFLISQIQINLGGVIPEEELKKLPSTQRNAMIILSKLKGTITETYDQIQTNRNLLASAFESPYKPTTNPDAQPRPQHASSMAGQLTNPKRRQRGGE